MKHIEPPSNNTRSDFAIYVHWPFCESKCPYCDFNSHVAQVIDHKSWASAYMNEIERLAEETRERTVTSVFFGGGTPSLMPPDLVDDILSGIRRNWKLANSVEVTLEANPGSVERDRFRGYLEAGVNRVSLGIQSLDDEALRLLGRRHSAADSIRALETAQALFSSVSIDLIYARQHQSLAAWESELEHALQLGTEHISLYQLTIEEGTVFSQRHKLGKLAGLPADELSADMYCRTIELCTERGIIDYEVSNLSRPGRESRHNLTYWKSGDYLGIGPGAHGRITLGERRYATECHMHPETWLKKVLTDKTGESERHLLGMNDRLAEALIMGLRLKSGVDIAFLERLGFNETNHKNRKDLISIGLLSEDNATLKTTLSGRLLLDTVLQKLV